MWVVGSPLLLAILSTLARFVNAEESGECAIPEEHMHELLEIVAVRINDKNDGPETETMFPEGSEFYVRFAHGSEEIGESVNLKKSKAGVNIHIALDKDKSLFCEIMRSRTYFADKVLYTAELSAQDLEISPRKAKLQAAIRDSSGRATSSKLELKVIQKKWKEIYADLNVEPDHRVDLFFDLQSRLFASTVAKVKNKKAHQLQAPVQEKKPDLPMECQLEDDGGGYVTCYPEQDEFDLFGLKDTLPLRLLGKLPFNDNVTPYKNRAEGIYKIRKMLQSTVAKPPEGYWERPTSDGAMKRMYFSSFGQFYIKKLPGVEAGYVADLSSLADYTYRNTTTTYEPYGCKTFFNMDGRVLKIEDPDGTTYSPGDKYWEWAKLKSRTSAFVMASFDHLAEAHYVWGNVPGAALRMFLSPSHPIRKAFTVHFYKTHYTCARAKESLFANSGLLFRSLSLDFEKGLEQKLKDSIGGFRFTRYSDNIKEQGVNECKFHVGAHDGIELHKILLDYAAGILDEVYYDDDEIDDDTEMKEWYMYLVRNMPGVPPEYSSENLKVVWGEIIFRVTGFHSSIGQVSANALDPSISNIRLQPKDDEDLVSPEESAIGVGLVTAITTVPCPRLSGDWKQVLPDPNSPAYAHLRKSLKKLGKEITQRNKVRPVNVDYHPDQVALSISS